MPAAPVIAFAGWVGAGIGTALGGGALAFSIGAAAANLIVGLGFANGILAGLSAWSAVVGVGSMLLKPKLMSSTAGGGGSQISFQGDPNAGVPLVLNRTGTAGNVIHVTSNPGQKNIHLLHLSVLSAGPCQNIESWFVENEQVPGTFGPLPVRNGVVAGGKWGGSAQYMIMNYQLGTQPEGSSLPTGLPAFDTPEWTDAHRLSGLTAVWWRLRYDQKVFASGIPKPVWWVVNGPAVYDPRLDDTWPGGSGPCRWDNEGTWTFDPARRGNPYCQALSWLAGRRQNGKLVHGVGLPRSAVDVAAYARGANVCDANGWNSCGGVVSSTDDKYEVLKALLQAGGGVPTRLSGMVSCVTQAPRVSLATITREDIAGECSVTASKPRRQRFNTGTPRYRSEEAQWQIVPGQVVQIPSYMAQDRGERAREVEFPLVQDKNVAAQLTAYTILDSREFEPVTIPLKPYLQGLKPGDCITVNEPELGMMGQMLMVTSRTPDTTTGAVTYTFRSETNSKHPFALGRTDVVPGTPHLVGWDGLLDPPAEGSFRLEGGVIEGEGSSIPSVMVVGIRDNPYAAALLTRYRVTDTGQWLDGPSIPLGDGEVRMPLPAVNAATEYEVQVAYLSTLGVISGWRSLGQIESGEFLFANIEEALSDQTITPSEKTWLIPMIRSLQGARTSLRQRAADFGLTEINSPKLATYENAQANLDAYLGIMTTPTGWNDSTGDTHVIDPAELRTRLENALLSQTELQSALDGAAYGALQDLLDDIDAITSDGALSPNDKLMVIPAIKAAQAARALMRADGDAAGLFEWNSTSRANYERWAVQELDSVLGTLVAPVAWSDPSGDTVLPDPNRFRVMMQNIAWSTQDLQAAVNASLRSSVNLLSSDGDLSPADKLTLVPTIKDVITGRLETRRKADSVSLYEWNSNERANYENAQVRLDQALSTMTNPTTWDNRAGNTSIPNPAAFVGALNDAIAYGAALDAQWFQLYNQNIVALKTKVDAASGAVTDGVLSRDEKNQFIPAINSLRATRARLRDEASALGYGYYASGPRGAFDSAADRLDNMLGQLYSPVAWSNTSDRTDIPNPTEFRGALEAAMSTTVDLQTEIQRLQRSRLGAWATYTQMDPGTVVAKTQWLDYNGQAFDHRAYPMNLGSGEAAQKNVWPFTSDTGNIYIQPFAEVRTNQTLYFGPGQVGGLNSDRDYDVFWNGPQGYYFVLGTEASAAHKVHPQWYIYLGRQRTAAAPAVWNPPPAAPGGYGGGGSVTPYPYRPYDANYQIP